MKTHLTDIFVKKKQCKGSQAVIHDDTDFGFPGVLSIRIGKKKKAWFISYRINDKRRKFTLGLYPDVGVADARRQAAEKLKGIYQGEDPQEQKLKIKQAPTINDLWEEYQSAMDRRRTAKAPRTRYEELLRWNKTIKPALGFMKVDEVKRQHLATLLNGVADRTPISANRLHSLLSMMFITALDLGWIEMHPMYMMKKPGGHETGRQRYLTDDEIRKIWPHFDILKTSACDLLKLGLYTAQRPGELMKMKWSDLDLEKRVWTMKNTKTKNTHLVPLSPQVYDILMERWEGQPSGHWVFPSRRKGMSGVVGHQGTTEVARRKVQDLSGVTEWTAHDLRRTARTVMSRLQIDQHIRERVLNHSQGGVQAVYDQYDYLNEKRDALEKLGHEIEKIVS